MLDLRLAVHELSYCKTINNTIRVGTLLIYFLDTNRTPVRLLRRESSKEGLRDMIFVCQFVLIVY